VKERWSPYFSSFRGSAPSVEVFYNPFLLSSLADQVSCKTKSQVRNAVLLGLSDPSRKIRSLCVSNIKSIYKIEFDAVLIVTGPNHVVDSEL
jgi:hypothetical protein